MAINWFSRDTLISAVSEKILPTSIVLDVGAGIQPQTFYTPNVHIVLEPFLPYVSKLQESENGIPRKVYLNGTWDSVMCFLPDKSVDTLFAVDVIEHFGKDEGLLFLKEAERVARCQIVIFTPLGMYPQMYNEHKLDRWGMEGGKWQSHQSGWEPGDFEGDWEFLACKDFHLVDQDEKTLDEPFGAFWAIKTLSQKTVSFLERTYLAELKHDELLPYVKNCLGERLLDIYPFSGLARYMAHRFIKVMKKKLFHVSDI